MDGSTIYTFGQIDTFVMVLEGLRSLFDPLQNQFFISSDGLGVGLAGTMAAILAMLGSFNSYQKTNQITAHGALLGLAVYALVAVPKVDTIWVEDLYTGEQIAVVDLPIGIVTIGVVMSSFTKNMTELFQDAYEGNFIVTGTDFDSEIGNVGFLSPLKMMVHLRSSMINDLPDHLISNLVSYSAQCLARSKEKGTSVDTFKNEEYKHSSDPLDYLFNAQLIDGSLPVEIVSPTTGNINIASCETMRVMLADDSSPGGLPYFLYDSSGFGNYAIRGLLRSADVSMAECSRDTANCEDASGAISSLNGLLNQVHGGINQTEQYMKVRLAKDISDLLMHSSTMKYEEAANVVTAIRWNIEQARMSEAIAADTFLKYMIPAMNMLLYVFYALFPLAMVVMVIRGTEALTFLGSYVLTAVWLYSWMPVAAVINYIGIAELVQYVDMSGNITPVSPANADMYIEQAMTTLSISSNLLAATPLITLAIISGSMFALTSVASSTASPSGSSTQAAQMLNPKAYDTPPLVGTSSGHQLVSRGGAGIANEQAILVGDSNTVGATVTNSSALEASQQRLQSLTNQRSSSQQMVTSNAVTDMQKISNGAKFSDLSTSSKDLITQSMNDAGFRKGISDDMSTSEVMQNAISHGVATEFGADVSASVTKGVGVGLMGNGIRAQATAGVHAGFTASEGNTRTNTDQNANSTTVGDGVSTGGSVTTGGGYTQAELSSDIKEYGSSAESAKTSSLERSQTLKKDIAATEATQKAFKENNQMSEGTARGSNYTLGQLANNELSNGGTPNAPINDFEKRAASAGMSPTQINAVSDLLKDDAASTRQQRMGNDNSGYGQYVSNALALGNVTDQLMNMDSYELNKLNLDSESAATMVAALQQSEGGLGDSMPSISGINSGEFNMSNNEKITESPLNNKSNNAAPLEQLDEGQVDAQTAPRQGLSENGFYAQSNINQGLQTLNSSQSGDRPTLDPASNIPLTTERAQSNGGTGAELVSSGLIDAGYSYTDAYSGDVANDNYAQQRYGVGYDNLNNEQKSQVHIDQGQAAYNKASQIATEQANSDPNESTSNHTRDKIEKNNEDLDNSLSYSQTDEPTKSSTNLQSQALSGAMQTLPFGDTDGNQAVRNAEGIIDNIDGTVADKGNVVSAQSEGRAGFTEGNVNNLEGVLSSLPPLDQQTSDKEFTAPSGNVYTSGGGLSASQNYWNAEGIDETLKGRAETPYTQSLADDLKITDPSQTPFSMASGIMAQHNDQGYAQTPQSSSNNGDVTQPRQQELYSIGQISPDSQYNMGSFGDVIASEYNKLSPSQQTAASEHFKNNMNQHLGDTGSLISTNLGYSPSEAMGEGASKAVVMDLASESIRLAASDEIKATPKPIDPLGTIDGA